MIKITKFGGSSVSSAGQFRKIKKIIESDPARRFVVVSAVGKRDKKDNKVTDLLFLVNAHIQYHVDCSELLSAIEQRFCDIASDLALSYPIKREFDDFAAQVLAGGLSPEYIVSRGEYFTAKLMAEFLGLPFVDAADIVSFHRDGTLALDRTAENLKSVIGAEHGFVLPGFYGSTVDGQIRLLDRGGGDITGAIVAQCLGADLYENWTDVSGFLTADPRIVDDPKPISRVTYAELRELSYMGAAVLHEEAIFPVRDAGIPLVIKNTNRPDDPGTVISEKTDGGEEPLITGITGKKDFLAVHIRKAHMCHEIGIMRKVLTIFERYRVSIEHTPSGVDSFAVVAHGDEVGNNLYPIIADIRNEVCPDEIKVMDHLALVATVGRNMSSRPGVSGKLFGTLGDAGINIRMIAQGSEEMNIIVGVSNDDFERAIRVIYDAFVDGEGNIVCVSSGSDNSESGE